MWIFDFYCDFVYLILDGRKIKKIIFWGARLGGEPKSDPNGALHYPCTVVHEHWIFLLLFIKIVDLLMILMIIVLKMLILLNMIYLCNYCCI